MLSIRPLTLDRWSDFEVLFGERGACGGCWCMWYRLPRAEYEAGKGEPNRRRMAKLVEKGRPTGVIAYRGDAPVGWCSVAPREQYQRLRTSRTMRSPDALPVWAILCLYVAPEHRGRGYTVELLRGAARFASESGAPAVEAYPVVPRTGSIPPVFASNGLLSSFLAAGFEVVSRPSESRAVVRWLPGSAG